VAITRLSPGEQAKLRDAELTYAQVGASLDVLPEGYQHLKRSRVLGSGTAVFDQAARDVLSWQVQERSGIRVAASSTDVVMDAVAVLAIGVGALRVTAPCRVVRVLTEPDRQGFAYGTLPGHPESGEEAFVVKREADGTVVFEVTAFSRPATLLAKAGGPIARVVQRLMTARYLSALAAKQP
jgi:uncharacterized protein (UPF0548 family)